MVPSGYFSVSERRREKQEARARDERMLSQGEVNPQELADRNGFFSSLDPARARIANRRVNVRIV